MEMFAEFLARIDDSEHRTRINEVLQWVSDTFPGLEPRVAWNQPMFTDHGTFIIAFSAAKHHLAVAPERAALEQFSDAIAQAGYAHSKELVRIPWDEPVDFDLLEAIIQFNVDDKANCSTFWRKPVK